MNALPAESIDVIRQPINKATIRLAGDSGDGMQLAGERFTAASAIMGNEVATLSNFPAEIRAPLGTLAGVSGFQVTFGVGRVHTIADEADTLLAMNPAALRKNIPCLKKGGILIVDEDTFTADDLSKAGYAENPLNTAALKDYQLFPVPMTKITRESLKKTELLKKEKEIDRCRNFFALGLACWLYQRDLKTTLQWLDRKFSRHPEVAGANKIALQSGWNYGESTGVFPVIFVLEGAAAGREPGFYRRVTGNEAAALGLVSAAAKAGLPLYFGGYPITPASEIMQELSKLAWPDVFTFQAEDEIAAVGAAVGAAYGGALAATATSGPGFVLKTEFINLAVMVELPLVVIDVQRAGPSTGLPTKTEQSDLLAALWGRSGDSPLVVMAAQSPKDCFDVVVEAARVAVKYMTPVVVLSDNYLSTGTEIWRIPELDDLPEITISRELKGKDKFLPYERNPETLARPWVVPGTAGKGHRVGGLEKDLTGMISDDPKNHQKMTRLRAEKINNVTKEIGPLTVHGDPAGKLLLIGWGSTYGIIRQVVEKLHKTGMPVACTHLRYLHPLPEDLGDLIRRFPDVLVPENNMGQLWLKLRAEFAKEYIRNLNVVEGRPFTEREIEDAIIDRLKEK